MMDLLNLLKELANWTGWAPIAVVEILFLIAAKFFYDRELANKDVIIQQLQFNTEHLQGELENSKQFRVDLLVTSLDERVTIANRELERLREDRNTSQEEIANKELELSTAQHEMRELKAQLQQYEYQLDNLLDNEPDYCQVCTVDDEHILLNTIYWGSKSDKLVGDTALVEVGVCTYCASLNLKCKVCGTITGIDPSATDVIECEGCYETLYTPLSFLGKKLDNKIKVSRLVSE